METPKTTDLPVAEPLLLLEPARLAALRLLEPFVREELLIALVVLELLLAVDALDEL